MFFSPPPWCFPCPPARAERVVNLTGTGHIQLPTHPVLTFGTNSFTVEFWFKPATNRSGPQVMFSNLRYDNRDTADAGSGFIVAMDSYNVCLLYRPSGYASAGGCNGYLPAGGWPHVAVAFNRSGSGTTILFLDGAPLITQNLSVPSATHFDHPTNAFRFGLDLTGKYPFLG